jgi:hypothetical protein
MDISIKNCNIIQYLEVTHNFSELYISERLKAVILQKHNRQLNNNYYEMRTCAGLYISDQLSTEQQ